MESVLMQVSLKSGKTTSRDRELPRKGRGRSKQVEVNPQANGGSQDESTEEAREQNKSKETKR